MERNDALRFGHLGLVDDVGGGLRPAPENNWESNDGDDDDDDDDDGGDDGDDGGGDDDGDNNNNNNNNNRARRTSMRSLLGEASRSDGTGPQERPAHRA